MEGVEGPGPDFFSGASLLRPLSHVTPPSSVDSRLASTRPSGSTSSLVASQGVFFLFSVR